ncbi:MAG: hypothetical protein PGN33_20025 [Methylobacterium radiotolerans]
MSNAPTNLDTKPVIGLDDLPSKIRNKITCDGDETTACWHWTGSFTNGRTRMREPKPREDDTGMRAVASYRQLERGTPQVHVRELGYATSALRVVYGLARRLPLADVPRLGRCLNDRCVSPHHVQELGPVVKGQQFAAALREMEALIPQEHTPPHPRPVLTGDPNVEQPLATLQRVRPFSGFSIESAEDECGLPRGSITPAIWAEYVAWDEATSDD